MPSWTNSVWAPQSVAMLGKAAGHRLHERHVPPLAAAGGDVAVGGAVEDAELVVGELVVVDERDPAARRGEAELRDELADADAGVAVDHLAEEEDRVRSPEDAVERREEELGVLALAPLEVREERRSPPRGSRTRPN